MSNRHRKIAVIGLPFYGHVMPTLPLLKELASAGCRVDYYNTSRFEWAIAGTGAEFCPYKSSLYHYPPVDLVFSAYNDEISFVLPQLSAKILNENYDLIIYDEYCPWVKCLILAHGIPSVCIHATYITPVNDKERPDSLIRGFEYNKADDDYIRDNGLSKFVISNKPGRPLLFDLLTYLDEVVERNRKVLGGSGFDGWTLLSAKADEDIVLVPDFFIEATRKLDGDYHYLATFQDIRPPEHRTGNLVYISLGTSYGEIEPLLTAINGGTTHHDYKYVFSTGNRPGEIKVNNPRIEIKSFVDQHEMLSRCAAFITHCGMGSVIDAILTTTPMLLCPQSYEQKLTANVLGKLGLGIFLEDLSNKGVNIEEAIFEAITSETMRTRLEVYRRKIVSAGGLERAMDLIRHLLR